MELFHASGLYYESGDVIHPGNWGRVILGAGAAHQNFYRELLFEEVRRRVAPAKPSRLRSIFGLRTVEDLWRYQELAQLRHGYRINIPDTAERHVADLGVFDRIHLPSSDESARGVVAHYWQGTPGAFMEVLVEAPGEVLERL